MKTTFAFVLAAALPMAASAEGWGSFSGYNAAKELITLAPSVSADPSRDPKISDITAWVYVGTKESPYAKEITDLCHQHKGQSKGELWCDGKNNSPLGGVTYRWVRTIKGPHNQDYSDKEIWECVSGCSSRVPKKLTYEY